MEPESPGAPESYDRENLAHIFNGIVEQSVAGIYLLQDGVMQYVNARYAEFFNTTPQRLIGRPLAEIAPPDQRESLVAQYERRVAGREPGDHFTIRADVRGMGLRLIQIYGKRIQYRRRPAVVGIGIDVTEQVQAHEELVESRAQLRALMSEVETIQDTERARIALELHDEIGGLLTAIKSEVVRLRRRLDPEGGALPRTDAADVMELTHDISGLAQEAIEAVRRISEELRPPLVEQLNLFDGIRDHVAAFHARYGLESSLQLPVEKSASDPGAELDMFRIVQESLTNIARHADATAFWVRIERDDDILRVTVDDDGVGLPESVRTEPEGLGLMSIRERARRLGGTATITRSERGGVKIVVEAPWAFSM